VAAIAAGGAVGAYFASRPLEREVTTVTAPPTTKTITATSKTTVPWISTATTTYRVEEGGPGIDYYYDPELAGTEITYLMATLPEKPAVLFWIGQFEEETGIKVHVVQFSEMDVHQKSAVGFGAQSPEYDIVDAGNFGAYGYAYYRAGFIETLDKYVAETPEGWRKDDIIECVMDACTTYDFDDEPRAITGLPTVLAGTGLWYRYDILEENGVSVPLPGTIEGNKEVAGNAITYDELLSYVKKCHNPPTIFGYQQWAKAPLLNIYSWEQWMWACGGDWYDYKDFTPLLDTPETIDATKRWSELNQYVQDPTTSDWGTQMARITSGKIAMVSDNNVSYPDIFSTGSVCTSENFKFTYHPKVISSPNLMCGGTQCINKWSKNKWAAWSFLSWLYSPRVQQQCYLMGNSPIRKSVLYNEENKKLTTGAVPLLLLTTKWFDKAVRFEPGLPGKPEFVYQNIAPKIPRWFDLVGAVGPILGRVTAGEITAEQAMKEAQDAAVKLTKEIGF